jgi:malonyl-CoA decarboxylase
MTASSFLKDLLGKVSAPVDPSRGAERKAREVIELCRALMSERGEVSGAALAREVLAAYAALPVNAHTPFLHLLAADFSPDTEDISRASAEFSSDPSPQRLIRLQHAVESPRQELFRRLNVAPGATSVLVDLRRRVLREIKSSPQLAGVDADLVHLFGSWFNRGFLKLERIDWRTPAIVLEKLIDYEAVHEIAGWKDLRRRLAADRRCFGFFHPALPDEPLIFIEVALTDRVSDAIAPLLDAEIREADPARADSAIFYSITNCQEGLRGISFGNMLIKQVVAELSREFPRLKNFATLSPVPGFRAWLADAASGNEAIAAVIASLQDGAWHDDAAIAGVLRDKLMSLCAHYLLREKKDGAPLDAVARFHLGNGARLERLNWLADTSPAGMQRSAGMMVNYVYRLDEVEANHEGFIREGAIAASHGIRKLARDCDLTGRRDIRGASPAN